MESPERREELRAAVEALHGGVAVFERVDHVSERHEGSVVWEDDVYVFRLPDHPTAKLCYAWSEPGAQPPRRRYYAVLHDGPVDSARKAVLASILRDADGSR